MIIVPLMPYFFVNGSIAGARPTPQSQTCVAGRWPAAIRALLTGWLASQPALRAMMSVSSRLPVPRGNESATDLSMRSCGGVARRLPSKGAEPGLPRWSKRLR